MYSACVYSMTTCQPGRAYSLSCSSESWWTLTIAILAKRHLTSQHVWVIDDKYNREMESPREFVYSSVLDRMLTWPSDADDNRRLTTKRLNWRYRIGQYVRNSNNCTMSLGGRFQAKSTCTYTAHVYSCVYAVTSCQHGRAYSLSSSIDGKTPKLTLCYPTACQKF